MTTPFPTDRPAATAPSARVRRITRIRRLAATPLYLLGALCVILAALVSGEGL